MDMKLAGKRCLVTGASRGLGRASAAMLAAEGCRTAIVARRRNLLDELSAEIVAAGGEKPVVIEADVTADDAAEAIGAAARKGLGGVDVLVNSAGGSRPAKWDAPEEAWEEGMHLNFTALRRLTTGLVPGMREGRWGRIINITGSVEPKGFNIANAAKSAVHAWAKGLSRVVGPDGITVNCIAPGRLNTEQIWRMFPTPEERQAFADQHIPVGFYGEPGDLACLVTFLASPLARYVTGELFHVDGGALRVAPRRPPAASRSSTVVPPRFSDRS